MAAAEENYTTLKESVETKEIFQSPLIYGCNELSSVLCMWQPEEGSPHNSGKELNTETESNHRWGYFAVDNVSAIYGINQDVVKQHYNIMRNGSLLLLL